MNPEGGYLVPKDIIDPIIERWVTANKASKKAISIAFNAQLADRQSDSVDALSYTLTSFKGEWKMKFVYIAGDLVNPDHIMIVSYVLVDITPELTEGDIYEVIVTIKFVDGSELTIRNWKELRKIMYIFNGDGTRCVGNKDEPLHYYLNKMFEYKRTVDGKQD